MAWYDLSHLHQYHKQKTQLQNHNTNQPSSLPQSTHELTGLHLTATTTNPCPNLLQAMPSVKFNASEPTPKMPKAPKKTGIEGFKAKIKKENAQRKKEFEEQKKCLTDDDDK